MSGRPIESVLVANRGEIAVRVIDACHRLGLRAVAVYSDADREAPHVARADAAMRLGPAPARDSYLYVNALLDAAHRAGADAVHPGYGFLAESAAFARSCAGAGLTFIGPHAEAIQEMGAKTTAKVIAARAGVPTVPGYHGEDQTERTLRREADRIGWPLLVKASAGGGGRGMRRVASPEAFPGALELARAEAEAAFGDPTLLIEKAVPRARHIEVQVLGDRHGNIVHLFERDCSLQRKHQKLIEEAPAPGLSEEWCAALRRWSLDLAAALRYDSVGTVEFIYDPDADEVWFLEMNTRLQVEHPVTEAVTGVDLVAWQIRVAGGEALDFGQDDLRVIGWAIEARVAAEDPAHDYAPRTGVLRRWRVPSAPGLRVDAGVETGSTVGHHYDSLLAKVIAHGRDREEARRRLLRALHGIEAVGVGVNSRFLEDLLALPGFIEGRPYTTLIEDAWPAGWRTPEVDRHDIVDAAVAAHLAPSPSPNLGSWSGLGAWRVTEAAGRCGSAVHYVGAEDGSTRWVRVCGRSGTLIVECEGVDPLELRAVELTEERLVYEIDGERRETEVLFDGESLTLLGRGGAVTLAVLSPERALLGLVSDVEREGDVVAPMPGALVEVRVAVGQAVRAGETLCVLEAMKLFQELTAPFDGTVAELRQQAGDTVKGGALLAVIAPDEPSAGSHRETRA